MAIIDKYATLRPAFRAAAAIKAHADALKAQSGPIAFRVLSDRIDGMRESYDDGIAPLLAIGNATQVNSVVGTFYAGTVPANTYTQFQAVGTALLAFETAYAPIFAGLDIGDYTPGPGGGHTSDSIPLAQLASLSDELDAVIAAVAPLV